MFSSEFLAGFHMSAARPVKLGVPLIQIIPNICLSIQKIKSPDTYRKHSVSELVKNLYFQLSTEMSDRVDYLRVSLSASDGEYGIAIFTGKGIEGTWDY